MAEVSNENVTPDKRMESLEDYRVQFDAYAGPLDLLLYLVRREEVDISRIALARVASDYLRCVELMKTLNVSVAGEFLLVAATLMELKSRLLLPSPSLDDEEEWEDPCAELVQQLMEYRRFKEAVEALGDRAAERALLVASPGEKPPAAEPEAPAEELHEVGLWDLIEAFHRLLEATGGARGLTITVDDTPQEALIERLLARFEALAAQGAAPELTLSEMVVDECGALDPKGRGRLVALFLVILELVKRGVLRVAQEKAFGEIRLIRRREPPVQNPAGESEAPAQQAP